MVLWGGSYVGAMLIWLNIDQPIADAKTNLGNSINVQVGLRE